MLAPSSPRLYLHAGTKLTKLYILFISTDQCLFPLYFMFSSIDFCLFPWISCLTLHPKTCYHSSLCSSMKEQPVKGGTTKNWPQPVINRRSPLLVKNNSPIKLKKTSNDINPYKKIYINSVVESLNVWAEWVTEEETIAAGPLVEKERTIQWWASVLPASFKISSLAPFSFCHFSCLLLFFLFSFLTFLAPWSF